MFVCNDCGGTFEKPAEREETTWAWGVPEEYILSRCPFCGGDDFSDGLNARHAAKLSALWTPSGRRAAMYAKNA